MFATYESIKGFEGVISQKEIIISKDGFNIIKEGNTNKLYLEKYPNNALIENIQDFKILEKNKKSTILKIFVDDGYIILDIQEAKKEKINRFENVRKNNKWIYEKVEKEKITIIYFIYKEKNIEKCDSSYIEGETNIIGKCIWPYKNKEICIKDKYFSKPTKNFLFNLFSK